LVPSLAEHPLPRMVDAGLTVTVNTDGEASLAAEYQHAREIFGYSDAELAGLARASIEGSFAPAELKAQISAEIDRWLSKQVTYHVPWRPRLPAR
jgi:adenosine deaminase